MTAGMKIIIISRHVLHPTKILPQDIAGKLPQLFPGGAGVHSIRRVGHDLNKMMSGGKGTKGGHIFLIQGFRPAAAGIPRKKSKRIRPELRRLSSHGQITAGGRQMTADMKLLHPIYPLPLKETTFPLSDARIRRFSPSRKTFSSAHIVHHLTI